MGIVAPPRSSSEDCTAPVKPERVRVARDYETRRGARVVAWLLGRRANVNDPAQGRRVHRATVGAHVRHDADLARVREPLDQKPHVRVLAHPDDELRPVTRVRRGRGRGDAASSEAGTGP